MTWHDGITIPTPLLKGFAVVFFPLSIVVFGILDPNWIYLASGIGLSIGAWLVAASRSSGTPAA